MPRRPLRAPFRYSSDFVGSAPLPPHERTWRHPSELAAVERQELRLAQAPTSTRAFALITGTLGLLAVGALLLSLTPRGGDAPIAIGATTLPRAGELTGMPMATPIGDGRMALTTGEAVAGTEFNVILESGPVVTAVVDATESGIVVLSITGYGGDHHAIAAQLPDADEIVTVLAHPPITIAFADIGSVAADEGTPVLDDDGDLVGLCTLKDGAEMSMVDVTGTLDRALTSTVPDSDIASSVVPSSDVPSSDVPSSDVASTAAPTSSAPSSAVPSNTVTTIAEASVVATTAAP